MYVKIFSKILDSSIWMESHQTRIVWFTMLAAMDEDGFAPFACAQNLAHRARVTDAECADALRVLEGPDANSSDPANEGRRVERVHGGWRVLNAQKYRDIATKEHMRESNRDRQRKSRASRRVTGRSQPVTKSHTSEAYAHADSTSASSSFVVPGKSDDDATAASLQGAGSGTPAMAPPVRGSMATAADRPAEVPAVGSAPIAPRIERQAVAPAADEDLFSTDKGVAGAATPGSQHGPALPPLPMRAATLADWRFTLPALLATEHEDVELARRLVLLYGHHATKHLRTLQATAAARPKGKRRVFVTELQEWLADRLEPDAEDYERAGIQPPTIIKNVSSS